MKWTEITPTLKAAAETNGNRDQIRLTISNSRDSTVEVQRAVIVRRGDGDVHMVYRARILENGDDAFQPTTMSPNSQLQVLFAPAGKTKPKPDDQAQDAPPFTLVGDDTRIQVTASGATTLLEVEATPTAKFLPAADSPYVVQHPRRVSGGTAFCETVRASITDALASWIGKAVVGALGVGVVALAVLLGLRNNPPESTETTFWTPPGLTDAAWRSAPAATCVRGDALAGRSFTCTRTATADAPAGTPVAPCFAVEAGHAVCPTNPWDRDDDPVLLTDPALVPAASSGPVDQSELKPGDTWGLELVDGRRCLLDLAAGGRRFACARSRRPIGPSAARSIGVPSAPEKGPWRIQLRDGDVGTEAVVVSHAWGVYLDT